MTTAETAEPRFTVPFLGAVHLKDGFADHTGQWRLGAIGLINLIRKEDLNINVVGNETSWALRVSDPGRPNHAVVLLGCQVRAVRVMPELPPVGTAAVQCLDLRL